MIHQFNSTMYVGKVDIKITKIQLKKGAVFVLPDCGDRFLFLTLGNYTFQKRETCMFSTWLIPEHIYS